jgi:Flp pilus assembly protein TadD
MIREHKLWRWLPLLPILALAEALLVFYLLSSNRPPEVTGEFIYPTRGSGQPVKALHLAETIAAQNGWTPELLHLAGDLWLEVGDVTSALPYWQAAAHESVDPVLLRNIAEAAIDLQDWASASDALERLTQITPDDAWTHFQLGLIQAAVNPNSALDHLTMAARESAYAPLAARLVDTLQTASTGPLVGFNVGVVMAEYELWSYAELAFLQATDVQPTPEALAYIGFARDKQGKDGSRWIEQAVTLAPDNANVRLLEGLHLRSTGEYAQSLDTLIGAVALDPQNPVLYAELGSAYQLLGDLSSARYWMEQAVALSGDDSRFQQMLANLIVEEDQLLQALDVGTEEPSDATAESLP